MRNNGKKRNSLKARGSTGMGSGLVLMLLCFGAVLGAPDVAGAETYVGGPIYTNTTWTKEGSPYIVNPTVIVYPGVTLTIDPEVKVLFNGNYGMIIDGTLMARGNAQYPILFTTHNPGQYWGFIHFRNGSTDAAYDPETGAYLAGSIMQYCVVEYAGQTAVEYNGALRLEAAQPFIDHCTIRNNKTRGICAWGLTHTLKITNNTISYNQVDSHGGGLFVRQSSYPSPNPAGISVILNNTVSCNAAAGNYGGGGCLEGRVDARKNVFYQNTSKYGGGLTNDRTDNEVSENIFLQNTASSYGGGMCGGGQTKNNIFADNQGQYGAAYDTYGMSTVSPKNYLFKNTFLRNTALAGTVLYLGWDTVMANNLVAHNQATGPAPTYTIRVGHAYISVNYSNIYANTTTYEVFNDIGYDNDAIGNWWGTTEPVQIQEKIYDKSDDLTKGLLNIFPWAEAIRTDAPISPPRNLTVTENQSGVVLAWQANPESNVEGYKIYWGKTSGYPYDNVRDVGNVTQYTFARNELPPPGKYYFGVTAYNSNYRLSKVGDPRYNPADLAFVADDPATTINELQTAGYESWFSLEGYAKRYKAMPYLFLLLGD